MCQSCAASSHHYHDGLWCALLYLLLSLFFENIWDAYKWFLAQPNNYNAFVYKNSFILSVRCLLMTMLKMLIKANKNARYRKKKISFHFSMPLKIERMLVLVLNFFLYISPSVVRLLSMFKASEKLPLKQAQVWKPTPLNI